MIIFVMRENEHPMCKQNITVRYTDRCIALKRRCQIIVCSNKPGELIFIIRFRVDENVKMAADSIVRRMLHLDIVCMPLCVCDSVQYALHR